MNDTYKLRCILVLAVILGAAPGVADEPTGPLASFSKERSWSDASGKFNVQASMIWADEQQVKLKRDSGQTVSVPLEKLSSGDKNYVQSFLRAEEALGMRNASPEGNAGDENPFAVTSEASNVGEVGAAGGIPMREASVKRVRPISVSLGKEFWKVPPLHGFPDVQFEEISVLADLPSGHAGPRLAAAGRTGNVVINAYSQDRRGDGDRGRFQVVSATSGESTELLDLPQAWKMMDLSADGQSIAAVRIEGWDKGNDVAIMQVSQGRILPKYQFRAGGGAWDELHFVKFLPGNRLMTISQKHTLVIWQLDENKAPVAEYRGNSGGKLWAALSPAGDMLAMIAGKSVAFIETNKFKLVGYIARTEEPFTMGFSHDGKHFATYQRFAVSVYSMETGQVVREFAISQSNPSESLDWVGQHLLVGSVLYDPMRGVPVWTYETSPNRTSLGNYLFCGFGAGEHSSIAVTRIPHDAALQMAEDIDPAQIYCIQPGDSVRVDYELPAATGGASQQIRASVEKKIAELGWRVSSTGGNRITVKLEQGARGEAEYFTRRGFGPAFFPPGFGRPPSGPGEKVSYTPWTHSLSIESGGSKVFQAQATYGAPSSLSSEEGQSTQAAVNDHAKPHPEYFSGLHIPPHLLKAQYQGGLGKSKITSDGIR